MSEAREWRAELFAAMHANDAEAIVAAFDGMRAELCAETEAIQKEVKAWRWLHWGHPEASWACPCGHAHGFGTNRCDECGTWRPMKAAILAEVQAGAPYTAELVEKHRAFPAAALLASSQRRTTDLRDTA